MRVIAAVVLCFTAMLAVNFGYYYVVTGEAFGVPFGWGFGAALAISMLFVPLTIDLDDLATSSSTLTVVWVVCLLVGASAIFGAGIVLHGSGSMFYFGAGAGVLIGGPLSYWAFGDDRRRRGVPRTR